MELSISVDDLRMELRPALDVVRQIGVHFVEVGAMHGPISPEELSRSGERHFSRHLADIGLNLHCLRGPTGGAGYADRSAGDRRLASLKRIINLASSLRVSTVSTTVGSVTTDADGREKDRLLEAIVQMADMADRCGVTVAIDTAGISAADLRSMLQTVNCPNLTACCDSGGMLLRGENPHRVADVLAGRIRIARARDAVAGDAGAPGHETAPGEGQLDPAAFLAALHEAGARGPLILSRTTGDQRIHDIALAKRRFESLLCAEG
ncbi:MAG: sugar phosphate isomerase/epimerase [Phycisphaerae bacterium]|nr:sugar phosphate isomerase/epimerase [Phycisphaerae bacterium]